MSAIAALALADGLATTRTFDVNTSQEGFNNPAIWLEKTAGSYAGYIRISQLVKRTTNGSTTRVSLRIVKPVLNIDGTLKSQSQANISFILPDSGTEAERDDLLAYARELLANETVTDAVSKLNPAY